MAETNYQMFAIGRELNFSNKDNSANFSGEKTYDETLRGVYFFYNTRKKTSNQISYSYSFSSSNLRGRPFNSWGVGRGWFWKKISCKRLSEEKNCMQHKCNSKLMRKKRGKNILPTRLPEKKNSWWPEITPPPPPPKGLCYPTTVNGLHLEKKRVIWFKLNFCVAKKNGMKPKT